MAPHLLFYQLLLVALVLVYLMMHVWWPDAPRAIPQTPRRPAPLRRKRSPAPNPFPGFIHKPLCDACDQGATARSKAPDVPPPLVRFTRGRQRTVDTQAHFCPAPHCSYHGWLGRGNLRSNGLPTICQAEFVTFFAPSIRPAYNEFGWHHSPYDDAAWPSGYAGVGRQYCVRPGHAAAPSPATPHTRC